MGDSSVTKLSTKKALSSLKFFMCCQGNKEDRVSTPDIKSGFLENTVTEDKPLDDFDIGAFIQKFLKEQICHHGNSGSVCVTCYFESQPNIENYIIRRPEHWAADKNTYENLHAGSPDSCLKDAIFVYDNQSFCENHDTNEQDICLYEENLQNALNDKQLQVAFDTDNISLCSSCYHSDCTICRKEDEYITSGGDKTEFTIECTTPTFDAARLERLLRELNPALPVTTCEHGNYGDASELLCCQGRRDATSLGSTDTAQSRDKDSGVGRTDEGSSNKTGDNSEQDLTGCLSPSQQDAVQHIGSNDSFTSNSTADGATNEDQLIRECNRFRQALEQRCSNESKMAPQIKSSAADFGAQGLERIGSQSSLERELNALHREMEQVQIECQKIVDAHKNDPVVSRADISNTSPVLDTRASPSRVVPRMGTRIDYAKQLALQQDNVDPIWVQREATFISSPNQSSLPNQPQNSKIILPLGGSTGKQIVPGHSEKVTEKVEKQRTSPKSDTPSVNQALESCRNAPVLQNFDHSLINQSLSQQINNEINGQICTQDPCPDCGVSKSLSSSSVNQITQTAETENIQDLYSQYADVMYTNQANLQHTMMVQQKLFQQKLLQQQQPQTSSPNVSSQRNRDQNATGCHPSIPSANANESNKAKNTAEPPQQIASSRCEAAPLNPYNSLRQMRQQNESSGAGNSANIAMEWVVKRRADGSRYITRRPMRSKMLKERAKKISEERCGMTTDDDAMSELKVGRYWSKDDRKRHLEKAKEYKRRKQEMLRARMETVRESEEHKRGEPSILELSQRKMMRHKSRKMYDDFTTVQEILAHGSRNNIAPSESGSHQSSMTPLLSVTTV